MAVRKAAIPAVEIEQKIYFIRGQKVMLDRDLAQLYKVETRNLNKAVQRNESRFPEDFMFQLSQSEFENLKFQFGTSSWGGTRKLPFVFTEQGIAMLSWFSVSDVVEVLTDPVSILRRCVNGIPNWIPTGVQFVPPLK